MSRTRQVLVACTVLGGFFVAAPLVAHQTRSLLRLSANAQSARVSPSSTATLVAIPAAGIAFQSVALVGERPFGVVGILKKSPYRFSMAVPENLRPGRYRFTAIGRMKTGGEAVSQPFAMDVERAGSPQALSAEPRGLEFEALGEELPVGVWGKFDGGISVDLTRSSLIRFSSSNPGIASVNAAGWARAVSPGTATITASYLAPSGTASTRISVTVDEPVIGLSATRVDFRSVTLRSSSEAQALTISNLWTSPVEIREVRTEGDFLAAGSCHAGLILPPDGNCSVNITFKPASVGARNGTLTIANGTVGPATVVTLTGQGIVR